MNFRSRIFAHLGASMMLAASGCSVGPLTGVPEGGLHPAIIEWKGWEEGESFLSIPTTASVGVPVVVGFHSWYGPGYATARGEIEVSEAEGVVRIEAFEFYDRENLTDLVVSDALREVTISFDSPGIYRIELVGRSIPGFRPVVHPVVHSSVIEVTRD